VQAESKKDAAQLTFATPQAAADALITACAQDDDAALLKIFGPEGKPIVESETTAMTRKTNTEFAKMARQEHTLVPDPMDPNKVILDIGKETGRFPSP